MYVKTAKYSWLWDEYMALPKCDPELFLVKGTDNATFKVDLSL